MTFLPFFQIGGTTDVELPSFRVSCYVRDH
jgi:hypothetical protein